MNYFYDPKEQDRVLAARESFSGRLLTNAQFDEAMAVTGIIEREIQKTGAFKEKLGDYAYAFARTEKLDAVKAETILRDLFKARTGQSMNQMREALVEREKEVSEDTKSMALDYAVAVGPMIEQGNKISFNRAFSHLGQQFASEISITEAGAKRLMKEEFAAAEGRDLYEYGKEVEAKFYKPQIEAEKEARENARDRGSQERQRMANGSSSFRRSQPRMRP